MYYRNAEIASSAPQERKPAAASLRLVVTVGIPPVARATGTELPLLRSCSAICPNVVEIVGSILRVLTHKSALWIRHLLPV